VERLKKEGERMLLPPRRNPQSHRVAKRHRSRCALLPSLPPSLPFLDQELDTLNVERGSERIGKGEGDVCDFACCPGDALSSLPSSFGEGVVDERRGEGREGGRGGGGGGGRERGWGGARFV